MNIIKSLLAAALLSLVTNAAQAGVKTIKTLPNGDQIIRIKTAGVFAPSTTTICRLTKAGDLIVLNGVGGPGFVPAVANAGGLVGAATQLRPARSTTNVEQSGGGASAGATNVNAPTNNTTTNNSGGPTNVNVGGNHNHHNGN
jgi:hypothetical protein